MTWVDMNTKPTIQPSTNPAGTLAEVRQKNIPAKKMHAISGTRNTPV
jgi:hypothetical protein